MKRCENLKDLISTVYPGIEEMGIPTASYMIERTILCPRTDDVTNIVMCLEMDCTYLHVNNSNSKSCGRASRLIGTIVEAVQEIGDGEMILNLGRKEM
ncbi:hypothetical protein C5167_014218 [Papaver somniferum]|uniref:Uncharacterized protein n=1 Tax=Papaver somniferum TaxID=3469 RepID=A0A4Y7J2J2_PAPSO|nr:hypothetical protein C5167_014218 [Papaver somniferum]